VLTSAITFSAAAASARSSSGEICSSLPTKASKSLLISSCRFCCAAFSFFCAAVSLTVSLGFSATLGSSTSIVGIIETF